MSNIPDKTHFANAYAGKAPWDIPGAQAAFVAIADQVSGSLLDAGCGTGENALYFAARGNTVTGIDFVEEAIRRAKQKAAERGLSANFLVMDALRLDTMPQTFDNALDCGLFHVFADADRKTYVAGLGSVVRPGGRLFLLCFSDAEPGTIGPRRVSQSELEAAFAGDWTIESMTPQRVEVIPEFKDVFSAGGPHAWLVVAQRKA